MNNIKFPVSKYYIFASLILPAAAFLLTTPVLIFGKLTTKDLPPLILTDILWLWLTILGTKKYFSLAVNELTALELNEKEIIDHVFNVRINWDNILDIRFGKKGNSYISISLKDKKAVISQTKNILKKLFFYLNILHTGSPVVIQTGFIKGKNSDIFEKVYDCFEEINSKGDISA